jgi:porin
MMGNLISKAVAHWVLRGGMGLALIPALALSAAAEDATDKDANKPTGFWERDSLTGDWGGLRSELEDAGIKLGVVETSDLLANVTGGAKTGALYEGLTALTLDLNLDRLAGWTGATVRVSAWQIHGRGLSANNVKSLMPPSSVEADRGSLLSDLYLDQTLFDGAASVRIGQQAVDDEFIISKTATLFINSNFGYPGLPSLDLPSGGPDYPFATPGVRLKLVPTDQLTVLAGAFNGDPAGPGTGDPQLRNSAGTAFRLSDGVLAFLEAQYSINQSRDAAGLPGTYKLGAWYDSQHFADQHFDRLGLSLADPRSDGIPRQHNGDWSIYGIADQMLWRRPGTDDQGLSAFARVMGAPANRNLIDFYADAGLSFKGPLEGRDDDLVGLAFAYNRISEDARGLDVDFQHRLPGRPVRNYENLIELTYLAQVTPWWQIQPDLQYVWHPGGHAPLPSDPTQSRTIKDAGIIGLRTTITF